MDEKCILDPQRDCIGKAEAAKLEGRIKALEDWVAKLEAGEAPEPSPEPEEWPEWVQPTGAHDCYNTGDKVTYNGQHYVSKIDGNVWSPEAYPAGWEAQA